MLLKVLADPVVVEQRVVHIDQERQRGGVGHGDILAHHSPERRWRGIKFFFFFFFFFFFLKKMSICKKMSTSSEPW